MIITQIKTKLIFPIVSSLAVHLILLLLFAFVYFENSSEENVDSIQLEYKSIFKQIPQKKIMERQKLKKIEKDPPSQNVFSEITETQDTLPLVSSNTMEDSSEGVSLTHRISSLNTLDSLIINNPSLMSLKYALSEKMKTEATVETDSAFIVRRLKESLIQYYKNKYPTPLSKFGNGNSGIPIDNIIDLFSSDDIDEKKIKEYLNIE